MGHKRGELLCPIEKLSRFNLHKSQMSTRPGQDYLLALKEPFSFCLEAVVGGSFSL